MKKIIAGLGICAPLAILLACQVDAAKDSKPELNTDKGKASYTIGVDIGRNFQGQGLDLDLDAVMAGIRDIVAGREPQLSDSMMQVTMMNFQKSMQAKADSMQNIKGKTNLQEGQAFLEENKMRPEVKTLESGLQYEVLKEGEGESPEASDVVQVHYRGTLLDGTEFDSSHKRGQPAEFPVNGVIKGWTEGLQLMKEGAKYKLFVPPELGYGERGAGGQIGPNATLIFEVELLDVKNEG